MTGVIIPNMSRRALFAGSVAAATLLAKPAGAVSLFGPTEVERIALAEKVQAVANASFASHQQPTVTSQNALGASRQGIGPAIPNWPQPGETRQIWLKRNVGKGRVEEVVARYAVNGQVDMAEYLKVCTILRDVQAGVVAYIDLEALDLIYAMQKWFVSWGMDLPLYAQSGFRTAKTNGRTEGAAKDSKHMKGEAIDARSYQIPVEYLGRLASLFRVGGVGFYVSQNFVHLDTGRVRYWRS